MQNQNVEICKFFRWENSHVPGKDVKEYWQREDESVKQFFCIKTMTQSGPDNGLVSPQECNSNRQCFLNSN